MNVEASTAEQTVSPPPPPTPELPTVASRPRVQLTGLRKAAILLIAIGDELAQKLLRKLPDNEVERVTEEIAGMGSVDPDTVSQVVEDFHQLLETQQYILRGGIDYASKLLVSAFGQQRADALLAQVHRVQQANQGNLAMLQKVDPRQLGKSLDTEHPQTIALVLAHLDPQRGSQVLANLGEDQRVAVVQRLAEMRQFSPEVAQKVAVILHQRLESAAESRKSYSGVKAVADLLNGLEAEAARKILESVERGSPDVAIHIRNLMFTFDDLLTVPQASVREIMALVDKRQLALALKGTKEDLREHIFKAMSTRAAELLKEDMEVMGPVRSRDVMQAQQEILTLARGLEADGKIILKLEQGDGLMI
jgi:flagellar motor switch protein FliG